MLTMEVGVPQSGKDVAADTDFKSCALDAA
jgi:hypothetical protein